MEKGFFFFTSWLVQEKEGKRKVSRKGGRVNPGRRLQTAELLNQRKLAGEKMQDSFQIRKGKKDKGTESRGESKINPESF